MCNSDLANEVAVVSQFKPMYMVTSIAIGLPLGLRQATPLIRILETTVVS